MDIVIVIALAIVGIVAAVIDWHSARVDRRAKHLNGDYA